MQAIQHVPAIIATPSDCCGRCCCPLKRSFLHTTEGKNNRYSPTSMFDSVTFLGASDCCSFPDRQHSRSFLLYFRFKFFFCLLRYVTLHYMCWSGSSSIYSTVGYKNNVYDGRKKKKKNSPIRQHRRLAILFAHYVLIRAVVAHKKQNGKRAKRIVSTRSKINRGYRSAWDRGTERVWWWGKEENLKRGRPLRVQEKNKK